MVCDGDALFAGRGCGRAGWPCLRRVSTAAVDPLCADHPGNYEGRTTCWECREGGDRSSLRISRRLAYVMVYNTRRFVTFPKSGLMLSETQGRPGSGSVRWALSICVVLLCNSLVTSDNTRRFVNFALFSSSRKKIRISRRSVHFLKNQIWLPKIPRPIFTKYFCSRSALRVPHTPP
jgi:hypothetical protein